MTLRASRETKTAPNEIFKIIIIKDKFKAVKSREDGRRRTQGLRTSNEVAEFAFI